MGEPKRGKRFLQRRAAFIARHSEAPELFLMRVHRDGLRGAESAADEQEARALSYQVGHPKHPLNPTGRWIDRMTPLEQRGLAVALFLGPAGYMATLYDTQDATAPAPVAQGRGANRAEAITALFIALATSAARGDGTLAALVKGAG